MVCYYARMKLSKWAKLQDVTYRTAWQWFKDGRIPGAYRLPTGPIVVPDDKVVSRGDYTVVYARVSSSENRSNLESQAARVSSFCAAKGWTVREVVKECASGLNDKRPKLEKLLKARKATRIVVEHKDRLTRFGFNFIKTLLNDCELVVINEAPPGKDELMEDFVALVTSFCSRLYGNRRSKRNTEKLIQGLNGG